MISNQHLLILAESSPELVTPTLLAIFIFCLLAWSLGWVYTDAEARGKNGCLISLLVFLISWPISLLVWMAFRPDLPTRQQRNAQSKCVNCKTPIEHGRHLCDRCKSLTSQESQTRGNGHRGTIVRLQPPNKRISRTLK